jgi:HJR/Mrr/RecB family endonuclease
MTLGDLAAVSKLESLDVHALEELAVTLFSKLGFEVEPGDCSDLGFELVLEKDGVRTAVLVTPECHPVRREAVEAVLASRTRDACEEAMVVTNTSFTGHAEALATARSVTLWGRAELERAMTSFCADCGERVASMVRRWCLDRPEEFHGRVYCFVHQQRHDGFLRTA